VSRAPASDIEDAVVKSLNELAGKLLKELGYDNVYNLGGFKDWTGAVDKT
jgi:hypothetical protein